MKSLTTKRNKYFKKMKQHPSKKNTDQYRETKRRLQKGLIHNFLIIFLKEKFEDTNWVIKK
jgi:hypothetical protein